MTNRRTISVTRGLLGLVAGAAVLTACGDSAESGVEKLIEGEDGSFSGGATTELPDEWPSDVPAPDGLTIASAFVMTDTASDSITVGGTVDGEDFLDEYGSALEAAGFESKEEFSADGTANRMYSSATWNVAISDAEDESGNQATISVYTAR